MGGKVKKMSTIVSVKPNVEDDEDLGPGEPNDVKTVVPVKAKEIKEYKESKEHKEHKEIKEHKEHKEIKEHKEQKRTHVSRSSVKQVTSTDTKLSKNAPPYQPRVLPKSAIPWTLVISHYEEPLGWVSKIPITYDQLIIYHKGSNKKKAQDYGFSGKHTWVLLENVGRESHTYLYHMKNTVLSLAKKESDNHVTVYLQGKIDDHQNYVFAPEKIQDYVGDRFISGNRLMYTNPGFINHIGNWAEDANKGLITKEKLPLKLAYSYLLEKPFPPMGIFFAANNCFGVPDSLVKQRGELFYNRAIEYVGHHVNPGEGHQLERLFLSFFQ